MTVWGEGGERRHTDGINIGHAGKRRRRNTSGSAGRWGRHRKISLRGHRRGGGGAAALGRGRDKDKITEAGGKMQET